MKQFFEQYGGVALGILALLVLIAMITPVGNIIKTSLQGTTNKFASSMNGQLDDAMNATMEAQIEAEGKNPYKDKVMSVQTLYDVGEQNLTANDIVTINGVDCYVLEATATTAKLITKDMYDVRFDDGGHSSADVEGHVGTGSHANKTYDYKYSTLRTWMDEFYRTQLGADSRILPTAVTYYTKDSYDENLDSYATGTIANQYVFALDAKEAKQYVSKFRWTRNLNYNYGFWTTAGCRNNNGNSDAWRVSYYGNFSYNDVDYSNNGARPVFWITLE